jgi:hypothetical protein
MELVALAPDVVLTIGTNAAVALQEASRTVPAVFTVVTDPAGAGLVASLARLGRPLLFRIRHCREMAGAAQRERAARDTGGSSLRQQHQRDRRLCSNPGNGTVIRS